MGGVGEGRGLEVLCAGDLQQRNVMDWVDANPGGLELLLVPERDLDGLRVVDDVVVGEDVTLVVDDEAGALALLRDWA